MKIRYFMSIYMFLALVFSSAIAMIPDNPDNNKRKRDDNSFEVNKRREIEEKEISSKSMAAFHLQINNDLVPKPIKEFNYDDFKKWEKFNEKQTESSVSSSSEQQSKNVPVVGIHEKRKIIEKVPENNLHDNQNFNINNIQNNLQENGSTVSMEVFRTQINNDLIPKPIKEFDYNKFLKWEKSHGNNVQCNEPIVVNNTVINAPVSISIQQQPLFSPEQMMIISQLLQQELQQQPQQLQHVVPQENIDGQPNPQGFLSSKVPSTSSLVINLGKGWKCPYCAKVYERVSYLEKHIKKCPKNLSDEAKKILLEKNKYITQKANGSYYCSVCEKNLKVIADHKKSIEHRLNADAGKNILKIKPPISINCPFPDCVLVFHDVDDFLDHMVDKHVFCGNCTHPECIGKKIEKKAKRCHFRSCHLSKSKCFFVCPGCKKQYWGLNTLVSRHLCRCEKGRKFLRKINKLKKE